MGERLEAEGQGEILDVEEIEGLAKITVDQFVHARAGNGGRLLP